jgi:signal transduction histidine kinase/ActR/RegA family two-component response regulator
MFTFGARCHCQNASKQVPVDFGIEKSKRAPMRWPSLLSNMMQAKAASRGELLTYGLLCLVALGASLLTETEKSVSIRNAIVNYKARIDREVVDTENSIESNFRQIHQGLRTIARLPGVRSITRYGENFNSDAKTSVQEIYNNLAENVAVSEVYIVPIEFDPDAIDARTGQPQEPIITFDDLIVGRTADTVQLAAKGKGSSLRSAVHVEEVEIYEYRLMKRQIEFLKSRFFDESKVSYAAYPAVSGEEVITCDNTKYSPEEPNDKDRMGLVYSVPFYDSDGHMKGLVTAVILSRVIDQMMPAGTSVLVNAANDFVAGSVKGTFADGRLPEVALRERASSLVYSDMRQIDLPDLSGNWRLWTSRANAEFWNSVPVQAIYSKSRDRHVATVIMLVLLGSLMRMMFLNQRAILRRNDLLETRVAERTAGLKQAMADAEHANAAKSQFLANISHEIRTPLATMIGMVDLVSRSSLPQSQKKQLDVAQSAGKTLADLIEQILDISAIEAQRITLRPVPTSLTHTLGSVVRLFEDLCHDKGIRIGFDVDERLPEHVLIDVVRLRQILLNLVGNAVKFTREGSIQINVKPAKGAGTETRSIWFEVSDTGIGISNDVRENLFLPFHSGDNSSTNSFGGTGLGLSISKSLVELMGGTLDFDSEPGNGSTFYFTVAWEEVPEGASVVNATEEAVSKSALKTERPTLEGVRVLLAEDNSAMQNLLLGILSQFGCMVTVVQNGQEAVEKFKECTFDVILMDCRMPVMDGYDATKAIRATERLTMSASPVPIVALTANAFTQDREASEQAGMTDFLSKPFKVMEVANAIAKGVKK